MPKIHLLMNEFLRRVVCKTPLSLTFFICYYCVIVIVVTILACTCFLFCIANLLFSYSATQPQV